MIVNQNLITKKYVIITINCNKCQMQKTIEIEVDMDWYKNPSYYKEFNLELEKLGWKTEKIFIHLCPNCKGK